MDYLSGVLERAKAANPRQPGDYIDQNTSQLMCGKCHTPKTTTMMYMGRQITVHTMCKCAQESASKEKQRKQAEERREQCFGGNKLYMSSRFSADDGKSPIIMRAAKSFAKDFAEYRKRGKGLIFLGPTGTGKTFASCCIANDIVEQGYKAWMTTFVDIEARLHTAWDKNEVYNSLRGPDLLILDDLGAERESSYMDEIIYAVIDIRCTSGKPLIVTSNMSAEAYNKAEKQSDRRMLSRLYKACIPVEAKGEDRRKKQMQDETANDVRDLLMGGMKNGTL